MEKEGFASFAMHIILLITFLGTISMVFDLHRFAFIGEFLILIALFLALIAAVMGLSNSLDWVWKMLAGLFAFIFFNFLFIYAFLHVRHEWFMHLLLLALAGFFIALFNRGHKSEESEPVKKAQIVRKEFAPGKYVGSKMGSTAHRPKCDWANNIKKKNMVWFDGIEEAKKAGYKAHDCIE